MNAAPIYVPAAQIWALRGDRARPACFEGLYVRGNIDALAAPTVALVGSRAASEQGRRIAWRMAAELGQAGVCVVSGLALGIDGNAHSGSVSVGAATVGVLGGGHNRFFPPRNRELAEAMIAHGGAVISPYAPDQPVLPFQFLERNGVIAALADAVVVVEAAARSGSLNTARWAGDSSVPVLAVPGDVDRPKVAGCLTLIRDGAILVRDADDVLEAIGMTRSRAKPAAQIQLPLIADALQSRIAASLAEEARYIEDLAARQNAPIHEILAALAHLKLFGIVRERGDGAYTLVTEA